LGEKIECRMNSIEDDEDEDLHIEIDNV